MQNWLAGKNPKLLLWQGATGVSLLVALALIAMVFFEGRNLVSHAYDNGQYVRFSLTDGSMLGLPYKPEEPKLLETAQAPDSAASAVPDTIADSPKPIEEPDAAAGQIPEAAQADTLSEADKARLGHLPLAVAPNPALVEETPTGLTLPKIGADGVKPWRYYAKPFDAPAKTPIIAVVISGLGLANMPTESAINLPDGFTLSFSPYASEVTGWAAKAREGRHEVLIDLPVQSIDYPAVDAGPYGLLESLSEAENLERLHWVMGRFPGYTGLLAPMDAQPAASIAAQYPEIFKRGLIYLDAQDVPANPAKPPRLKTSLAIDDMLTQKAITDRLATLESIAKQQGYAIGVAKAYPITLQQLKTWQATLEEKGIVLAPVSAVAKRQYDK
jgi:uncharacterized protein